MIPLCLIIMAVVVLAAMFQYHRATEKLIDKQALATTATIDAIAKAVEQSVLSIVAPPPLADGASPTRLMDPAPMPNYQAPDDGEFTRDELYDPTDWTVPDDRQQVAHGADFGLPLGAFDAQ